jgi:hypothetical protein
VPFTYRIDPHAGVIFYTGEGRITQSERLETILAALNDPDHRPGFDALCDFSAATSIPTLPELRELIELAQRHAPLVGHTKMAIVAASPVVFGVARQFEALAGAAESPLDVRVFSDRDAAWAWLRPPEG